MLYDTFYAENFPGKAYPHVDARKNTAESWNVKHLLNLSNSVAVFQLNSNNI